MKSYELAQLQQKDSRIVVLPAGSKRLSQTCKLLIETLTNKGMVLVAAAGNNNTNHKFFPAALPDAIGVAASNKQEKKTTQSNYGSRVDIVAPGEDIFTTIGTDEY